MTGNSSQDNPDRHYDENFALVKKAVLLLAATVVTLWFLNEIALVILFFLFAVILSVALNPPVSWLERRRVTRALATIIVGLGVFGAFAAIGSFVIPEVGRQAAALGNNIPSYVSSLNNYIRSGTHQLADSMPGLAELKRNWSLPSLQSALLRVGRYTLSGLVALIAMILLATTVMYTVAYPRPLLTLYLDLFPPRQRERAVEAFVRGAQGVNAWIWSNIIVGGLEAIMVAVFLSFIGIPGAFVWGFLAFFSELVPTIGAYLMSIPPILVALAINPLDALWVTVFYIILNQFMSTIVAPLIRANQMEIHPTSLLFTTLALGGAFGLTGALIATPLTGFLKAFYEEFYRDRAGLEPGHEVRLDRMLFANVPHLGRRNAENRSTRGEGS